MDYRLHYNKLIDKALSRGWIKKSASVYVEQHHIIPRSMNGPDDISNLVLLTAREHFIAHLLLAKIYGGNMWHAAHMMSNMDKYTNRKYENVRIEHAKQISLTQKGKYVPKGKDSPLFGLKRSKATKDKLSAIKTGSTHALHTEETKQKMKDKRKLQTKTHDKEISVNGIIFRSATKAAEYIGISVSALCKRMKTGKYTDYFYL